MPERLPEMRAYVTLTHLFFRWHAFHHWSVPQGTLPWFTKATCVNQRAARLNLVLVFYRAWPLKGQFLCKQLCVPVLKADRKVQNRVVRGVGQLGRDGGFNRQSSLKVYKSWIHKAAGPLKAREGEKEWKRQALNSLCAINMILFLMV